MRHIELETWPRRELFEMFATWELPHFNLCANVDISAFHPAVKQRGVSFTVAMMYVLARAANEIPEFRYRIRGKEVIEHEIVHPSTTILTQEDLFGFCAVDYVEGFDRFAAQAAERIARAKVHQNLDDGPEQDSLLYMTPIPWVSFTSFMHPLSLHPIDSIPRFAWGKYFGDGESLKMPLGVQAHHALMDGVHMGRLYTRVQEYFDRPELYLG
jgi:chloramphenicol O-acetyltransferase type A